ncbi:hypothetical protein ACIQOV_26520 [Kitasatospora sp. NPDC091257]|uniref:hypothetical protein n=1 Tax=Kitasatospora sp. NPDC091257 TaxID=3364084 RepID=UPI0038228948
MIRAAKPDATVAARALTVPAPSSPARRPPDHLHTSVTVDRPDLELQTLTVDGNVQVSGQTNAQGLHCAQTAPILLQSGTSGQRHPMSVLVRKGRRSPARWRMSTATWTRTRTRTK